MILKNGVNHNDRTLSRRCFPMHNVSFLRLAAVALTTTFCMSPALVAGAGNPAGHARVMITSAIDETNRISIEGNTRPEANAKNDRGIVAEEFAMEHMQLLLRRP